MSSWSHILKKYTMRVALACFTLGALIGGLILGMGFSDVLESRRIATLGATFSDMWFAPGGHLIGVRQEGGKLTVETASPSGAGRQLRTVELRPEMKPWVVAEDGSSVAWVLDGVLTKHALEQGRSWSVKLSGDKVPVSIGLLEQGLVALLFEDARVELWNVDGGRLEHTRKVDLKEADTLLRSGRYVAVGSRAERAAVVYDVRDLSQWSTVETLRIPLPWSGLRLSDAGHLAALMGEGTRTANVALAAPGALRAVAFGHDGQLMAGGEFGGVFMLETKAAPRKIADTPAGTAALAANQTHLAFSGPAGTMVCEFFYASRLNRRGVALTWVSGAAFSLAFLVPLSGFLSKFADPVQRMSRSLGTAVPGAQTCPNVPAELLQACAAGKCVLWAGAGLGMSSGLPGWRRFVTDLVAWAVELDLIDKNFTAQLRRLCQKGDFSAAANHLVVALKDHRREMLAYYRQSFLRHAGLSPVHLALGEVPFSAVLTTNYDALLERTSGIGGLEIYTALDDRLGEAAELGRFFLLKLYGDLENPKTARLSPAEFAAAASGNRTLGQVARRLFSSRTMLFLGASPRGLEGDLKAIDLAGTILQRHYALAAVPDRQEAAAAMTLQQRYNIETLVVWPGEEDRLLAEFLGQLGRSLRSDAGQTAGQISQLA